MAHEAFGRIRNPYVREIASEIITGGVKFSPGSRHTRSAEAYIFPPEPAFITSAMLAYIDRDDQLVHEYTSGLSPRYSPAKREVADIYDETIGLFEVSAASLEGAFDLAGGQSMEEWSIAATQRTGRRLVAAHIIARTQEGARLIDAIGFSEALHLQAHVRAREVLTRLSGLGDGPRAFIRDNLGEILRQEPGTAVDSVAPIMAAALLPTVIDMRQDFLR